MKILNLEIRNIRGIPFWQHDFGGKNAVILGANGTGKSSVVDAIDFLLTGDISRLQGEGTAKLSLKKHGVHLNKSAELGECYVKASVKLEGHASPVLLERSASDPEHLICCDSAKSDLEMIRHLATQGQHMLQRRQMLRFVAVSPNNRASLIQSLLDLETVENTRRSLQAVTNELRNQNNSSRDSLRRSEAYIATLLGLGACEDTTALHAINEIRDDAGFARVSELTPDKIKEGIRQVRTSEIMEPSPTLVLEYITKIEEMLNVPNLASFAQFEKRLREKLVAVKSDPNLLSALDQLELIRRGLNLIRTDACPLCDRNWKQDELKTYLQSKVDKANDARKLLNEIDELSEAMNSRIHTLLSSIPADLPSVGLLADHHIEILSAWRRQLDKLTLTLQDSLKLYPNKDATVSQIAGLFVNAPLRDALAEIRDILTNQANENSTNGERLDTAVEKLTLIADRWPELLQNRLQFRRVEFSHDQSVKLLHKFIESRDIVLSDIYEEVSYNFASLYRQLHGTDENAFAAQFTPRGAALHLEVDFYGRDMFPPNAYHSEGHQDSMGLCLYLVLSERLSGDALQTVLLDDVVTSVDVGHRRELARLLASKLPSRQIILTTHDRVWAKMLIGERFAERPNLIRFDRWDIDAGVIHSEIRPDWDLVEDHLRNERLVEAASILRNWAERYFKAVCHGLKAPVPFDIDGRYTLDDVLSPGLKRYKELVTRGINNARKNGSSELLTKLESTKVQMVNVREAIDKEVWLINRALHDNEGIDPTSDEIQNALRAFQEFYKLLHCVNCSRMVLYSQHNKVVHCKCGTTLWAV